MTVIAALAALAAATCVGYHFGRRAASTAPGWRKRTTRIALGRQAIGLLALITARRIQRRFRVERILADTAARYVPRAFAPPQVRRGTLLRLRSYQ
nr:hypothetical protein [Mycobacterium sp. 94-17]